MPWGGHEGRLEYPILLSTALELSPTNSVLFVEIKDHDDELSCKLAADVVAKDFSEHAEVRFISFDLNNMCARSFTPRRKCLKSVAGQDI